MVFKKTTLLPVIIIIFENYYKSNLDKKIVTEEIKGFYGDVKNTFKGKKNLKGKI